MEEFRSLSCPTAPANLVQGTQATNLEIQELMFDYTPTPIATPTNEKTASDLDAAGSLQTDN